MEKEEYGENEEVKNIEKIVLWFLINC